MEIIVDKSVITNDFHFRSIGEREDMKIILLDEL